MDSSGAMHTVLGATGGIVHWVVQKLLDRRENVRIMVRNPKKVKHRANTERVEIVEGDALVPEDVKKAAAVKAESIYHCVNVPYPEWGSKVIPMLESTMAAARINKAKIVLHREVREMLYLTEERLILDGAKFRTRFGRIPLLHTRLESEDLLNGFG